LLVFLVRKLFKTTVIVVPFLDVFNPTVSLRSSSFFSHTVSTLLMDKPPAIKRRAYTIGFHRYWISLLHLHLTVAFQSSSTSRRWFFIRSNIIIRFTFIL